LLYYLVVTYNATELAFILALPSPPGALDTNLNLYAVLVVRSDIVSVSVVATLLFIVLCSVQVDELAGALYIPTDVTAAGTLDHERTTEVAERLLTENGAIATPIASPPSGSVVAKASLCNNSVLLAACLTAIPGADVIPDDFSASHVTEPVDLLCDSLHSTTHSEHITSSQAVVSQFV
jgi:hypothetical protein